MQNHFWVRDIFSYAIKNIQSKFEECILTPQNLLFTNEKISTFERNIKTEHKNPKYKFFFSILSWLKKSVIEIQKKSQENYIIIMLFHYYTTL